MRMKHEVEWKMYRFLNKNVLQKPTKIFWGDRKESCEKKLV